MKRILFVSAVALLLSAVSLPLFTPSAFAQDRAQSASLGTKTTTGTGSIVSLRVIPARQTIAVVTTGSPSACSVKLEGSIDKTNFFDLSGAQDCTSSLMFHIVNKPVQYVRMNLTALSGGTSPTVSVFYVGVN